MNRHDWQLIEFYLANDYMCLNCHTIFGIAQPESEYTPFVSTCPEHEEDRAEDTYCSDTGLEILAHNAGLCRYYSNNRHFEWNMRIVNWKSITPECPLCTGKITEIDEWNYPIQTELRL